MRPRDVDDGARDGEGRRARVERGVCRLTPEGFSYACGEKSYLVPIGKLPALAFSCAEEFELYHENELHYFYPLAEPLQVARWALAMDLMAERRKKEGEPNDGKA